MYLSEKLFMAAFFLYLAAVLVHVILVAFPKKSLRNLGLAFSISGLAVHTAGLLVRFFEAGLVELGAYEKVAGHPIAGLERWRILLSHPPFTNLYESMVFFAWGVMVIYLVIEIRRKPALVGLFANTLVLLAMGLSSLLMDREIVPLVPALQSWWLHLHVAMAATGYGAFLVAAIFSFLYLLKDGVDVRRIGLVVAVVSVLMLAGLARGTPLLKGEYSMGLVSRSGPKPAVVFMQFGIPGRDGASRMVDMEMKKPAPGTGPFLSLAALAFLVAGGAYASRRSRPVGRSIAGDAAFSAGFLLLTGALLTFVANTQGSGPAVADEAGAGSIVAAAQSTFGAPDAGGEYQLTGKTPFYFSIRASPYDFALMIFLWLLAAFQILLLVRGQSISDALPDRKSLDESAYRITLLAFPMMTLIIVTGAVWAHFAWGRYWGWDPKETWSLITWFVYAFYLHARITHGWTGRPSAVISVIGFAVVVFTYLGVNLGLTGTGLHVYGRG
jgi:ABC-type transport system involved in cytochrome c biogenesis permease subunit